MTGRCSLPASLNALVLSSFYKNSSHSLMDSLHGSLRGQAAAPTGAPSRCRATGAHALATAALAKVWPDTKQPFTGWMCRRALWEGRLGIQTLPRGALLDWTVASQAGSPSQGCLKTRGPLSGQKVRATGGEGSGQEPGGGSQEAAEDVRGRESITMFGISVQGLQKEDPVVREGYSLSDETHP